MKKFHAYIITIHYLNLSLCFVALFWFLFVVVLISLFGLILSVQTFVKGLVDYWRQMPEEEKDVSTKLFIFSLEHVCMPFFSFILISVVH